MRVNVLVGVECFSSVNIRYRFFTKGIGKSSIITQLNFSKLERFTKVGILIIYQHTFSSFGIKLKLLLTLQNESNYSCSWSRDKA